MTTEQIAITVVASLLSGILGVVISTIFYVRHERKKAKIDTLKRFRGNRFDLHSDEFSRALNEIFVVFKDSRRVKNALSDYHEAVTSGKDSQDRFILSFKAMCKDVNLDYSEFNDSFFLRPFNTRPGSAA
jgi:hypothetical protein